MNYQDIEKLPELPEYTLWPIFVTLGVGILVSIGAPLFHSSWFFLGYLPWVVVFPWTMFANWRRHRRFMRACDGWGNRMRAYHDTEMRRIQARWS